MERQLSLHLEAIDHDSWGLQDLADGKHEFCKYCGAQFPCVEGKMQRYRALDMAYYCSPAHASLNYGLVARGK